MNDNPQTGNILNLAIDITFQIEIHIKLQKGSTKEILNSLQMGNFNSVKLIYFIILKTGFECLKHSFCLIFKCRLIITFFVIYKKNISFY